MKLLTVLIALSFLIPLYHLFELILQPSICTISLFTLFFTLSPVLFSSSFSLSPTLVIIGSIKDIYIPSSLTSHSWAGKTLPIRKDSIQAGHNFSPPNSQNCISLKHSWRLLSRLAVRKVFYEVWSEDWEMIFHGAAGLSLSVDTGMTTEDSFDERGCHCDVTVEDLSAPLKAVIRAVRWDPKDTNYYVLPPLSGYLSLA